MQPGLFLVSVFLTLTSAQTSTTTSSSATSSPTNLPSLVASLPRCALGCLAQAATAINCAPTDFTCLCADSGNLVSKVGPCIISGSGCSPDDISKIKSIAPEICGAVAADKNATDVMAASSLVSSALATVTGTPTASGNGAAKTGAALGVMGLAGAFAVLGL